MSQRELSTPQPRIFLSPPHMGNEEKTLLNDAFDSNWIAPLGPHVDAFEQEIAAFTDMPYAVALSSGTAAIHLALRLLGIQPGDEVICSSLTFVASANPIVYEGAHPVFIDSEAATWNMSPDLLREELRDYAARGKKPRAVIVVDLYGQSADYERIQGICDEYEVPLIEDAAEALGATYKDQKTGSFGKCGVFSFNGNKIITTSGGGMLVSHDAEFIEKARFLATQARDPASHYQHSAIGFNYRLSNLLAAIGRGQLRELPKRIEIRKGHYDFYKKTLGDLPGVEFMPIANYGQPNYWLTCITLDPALFGATREDVRLALEAANIESRPVWKPLHMQPIFAENRRRGGEVSQKLFENGLCLPSGSALKSCDLERIINVVRGIAEDRAS